MMSLAVSTTEQQSSGSWMKNLIAEREKTSIGSFWQRYSRDDLVLIYQFGKVGSTTLADSIEGAVNVHDLFGNPLCPPSFRQRHKLIYRWFKFPIDRFLRRRLIGKRKETKIIVPLRTPWSRNISMFFQDLPFWYVKHFSENRTKQKIDGTEILKHIFQKTFDHDGPDKWFQNEFCRLTGISFEAIPFDKKTGFSTIKKGPFHCLFLTTDLMRASQGKEVIETFLGRSIDLTDTNRGDRKWYAAIYKQLLDDKSFVEQYQAQMASSKVHQKFFA